MSEMNYLNLTVRRVDRSELSPDELEQFSAFFDREIMGGGIGKKTIVETNWKEMYVYFEVCGLFDETVISPFAELHPEYQIELIKESSEDGDAIRCLYQGDIMEILTEVRYFPEPERIQWKYGE